MDKNPKGGIYVISVAGFGNYYGESNNILRRWASHRKQLYNKRHANHLLKSAWMSLGPSAFTFQILESSEELTRSKELRLYRELVYINRDPSCLNIKDGHRNCITVDSLPNRPVYRNKTVILQRKAKGSKLVRVLDQNRNLLGVEAVEGKFGLGTFTSDNACRLKKVTR